MDAPDTFLALARGYIDHEAAHLRDTDFAALKAANLTPLEHHVWNIIEDWRVENRLVTAFPGCRGNFDWLIEHVFDGKATGTTDNPAVMFLNWLLLTVRAWDVPDIGKRRDTIAVRLTKLCPGLLTRMACVVEAVRTSCASTAEAIVHARAIVAELGKAAQTPQPASGRNPDASQTGGTPEGGAGNGNQPTMTDHESRDEGVNRAWVFPGGCPAGVAGVFVAAIVADTSASLEHAAFDTAARSHWQYRAMCNASRDCCQKHGRCAELTINRNILEA